jgi:hypothetical protein
MTIQKGFISFTWCERSILYSTSFQQSSLFIGDELHISVRQHNFYIYLVMYATFVSHILTIFQALIAIIRNQGGHALKI